MSETERCSGAFDHDICTLCVYLKTIRTLRRWQASIIIVTSISHNILPLITLEYEYSYSKFIGKLNLCL